MTSLTFLLVLQKMTACVTVSVSYRSQSVSNFHSSRSTATKNCLIPCGVQKGEGEEIKSWMRSGPEDIREVRGGSKGVP